MLKLRADTKIFVCTTPTDMRKSINGLSAAVVDVLNQSPTTGQLYVFYNRAKDKVKLLWWDRNGYVVYYKRLEKGKFKLSTSLNESEITLTSDELSWLLAGLDFMSMREFPHLNYINHY